MYYAIDSNAQANQSLSNLTAPTAVNKDLKPNTNNTKDLGGALISWRNIYLSNGFIYIRKPCPPCKWAF
jgi:hypothetical protein